MSFLSIAQAYDALPPGEQSQFAEAVRRLFAEGMLWRGDERDRTLYLFLLRRSDLVSGYLGVAGWELRHDERLAIFQLVHREGAHRRRLSRETTIWLLLLRLLYAEQRESTTLQLGRHPTVTVGELYRRYAEYFPGKSVRKKSSLDEGLRTLQALKLIRPAGTGSLRAANTEQLIELLPTLEVVVPANEIAEVAERLATYERGEGRADEAEEREE